MRRPRGIINGAHVPPAEVTTGTEVLRRRWYEDLTTRARESIRERDLDLLHRENHELQSIS